MVRILINECYTILRKSKRIVLADAPEDSNDSPSDPMDGHLRDRALHEAVQALPEKHRLAVVLHYIEGATVQEAAAMLRVPVGTVKSRLNAARGLLRAALREEV